MNECVAVCCSVLQYVAVIVAVCDLCVDDMALMMCKGRIVDSSCCSVLQCVAVIVAVCCSHCCSVQLVRRIKGALWIHHVAVCCGVLQCVAVCCSVLQSLLQCATCAS